MGEEVVLVPAAKSTNMIRKVDVQKHHDILYWQHRRPQTSLHSSAGPSHPPGDAHPPPASLHHRPTATPSLRRAVVVSGREWVGGRVAACLCGLLMLPPVCLAASVRQTVGMSAAATAAAVGAAHWQRAGEVQQKPALREARYAASVPGVSRTPSSNDPTHSGLPCFSRPPQAAGREGRQGGVLEKVPWGVASGMPQSRMRQCT